MVRHKLRVHLHGGAGGKGNRVRLVPLCGSNIRRANTSHQQYRPAPADYLPKGRSRRADPVTRPHVVITPWAGYRRARRHVFANTMDPQACYELLKERAKVSNTIAPPVPPPAAGPLEGMSLAMLGQRLLHWQSERVGAYQRFEEGFVRFLQVAEAQGYEALVASTTAAFASISDEINAICAEMERQQGAAAALGVQVRRLQDAEREKLALTAQLQIVRHGRAVDAHRAQAADEAGTELPDRERRTAALRAEEASELAEKLAATVESINDTLDEIRSELADLAEEEHGGSETR